MLTELMNANAERKVNVTYPDNNGNHTATIRDISERFIKEGSAWRKLFFETLLTTGTAKTRFGSVYTLIN